ncbi:DUF1697 domain-containing protein [Streptococcus suis]|nr:DUF1697 domain-containing protein [Streptococcus suis]
MVRYVLLLRGINVGGRNKVVMAELRQQVEAMGYTDVETYINSGNLFFSSAHSRADIVADFDQFFAANYPFVETFALLSEEDYGAELAQLPAWWQEDYFRKNVLFFTEKLEFDKLKNYLEDLGLGAEIFQLTDRAIYWAVTSEAGYHGTAYHKKLAGSPFYKQLTIRNDKTFEKLGPYLNQ